MSSRKGIRAYDKSGRQGYVISHSNKVLYPDKNSPTGMTTLTQALGSGQFQFESTVDVRESENIGDPIVDPLVKAYIDKLLSSFITEVVTIKSSDWEYDEKLERYKVVIPYVGMRAGVYPSYGLVPSDLLPTDLELMEFKRIECAISQENVILFIAKEYPKTTLNVVVKGITDYGGLDANLEVIQSDIQELRTMINNSKSQYYSATILYNEWKSNKTIRIANEHISLNSDVEIYMDPEITESQYTSLMDASMIATSIEDGAVLLKCLGTQPIINIPIILKITT